MFDYSRFKGVSWDNIRNKWYSRITFAGKRYAIGRFSSKDEAILAYKIAREMGQTEFKAWYNKDPSHRGSLIDAVAQTSDYKEDEMKIKSFSIFVDSADEDKKQFSW